MAATVNASTSAGVVITPDNSGVLALQSSSTTALTIDASQNSTFVGTASATKLIPTGSSATGNGLYLPAANSLGLSTNGTNAVYIDSSQNVGIGTASLAAKLTVQVTSVTTLGAQASSGLIIAGGGSNNNLCQIALGYGTTYAPVAISSITTTQTGNTIADLIFATRSVNTDTAPTERMRIDSSGNLLVGGTSAVVTAKLGIYQTSADAALFINPSNASYNGTVIYTNTTRAASSAFDFIGCYGNAVGQFRVGGNGVIYAQNTSVQSISDQRLKENIRDSSDGLSVINGLRPVRYDWKAGYGNNQKNQLGFIAQEIETVFPEAVSEWQVDKNDETVYKTVGPGALIPVLVKAIQEQQALITAQAATITALTARIVALENR